MDIRIAHTSDSARWDAYALGHPNSLAYHRFGWLQAVNRAYGFRTFPLLAERGGKVVGLLPLAHIHWPLSRGELVSLPYCDIGGVLADGDDIAVALLDFARSLAGKMKIPSIQMRSATAPTEAASPHPNKVRMVLDLPDSSEDLLAGFKAKLRSQIKKPIRDGLKATIGGVELLDDFYRVFAENMRDLGSPVHARTWFKELLASLAEAARVGLVSMPDGSPAAAGIILCHGATVSIPWASSLRSYNRSNPNMLLYWKFLSFAADNGYSRIDFGRSTKGEGTYKFKKQWGAQESNFFWETIRFKRQERRRNPISSKYYLDYRKRNFFESIWKKMPVGISVYVGPAVRRYISL